MIIYRINNATIIFFIFTIISVIVTTNFMIKHRTNTFIKLMRSSHGQKQSELIHRNSRYLTEKIDLGTDKEIVLDILGPPLNSQDDPIWLYPRAENDDKIDPAFYCIIINGKVVYPINKVSAADFDYSYRDGVATFKSETNYNKYISAVKKYIDKK